MSTTPVRTPPYRRRVRRVIAELKASGQAAALLLSSAPPSTRSRDTSHPYRQCSDFYYLTGASSPDLVLLLRAHGESALIAPEPDEHRIVWEGRPHEDPRAIAQRLGITPIIVRNVRAEVLSRLRQQEALYFQNTPGSVAWNISRELIETSSHLRGAFPRHFVHADALLEEMRLYKEPFEVRLISEAATRTNRALYEILPFVDAGQSEANLAATIDYWFKVQGAVPAFNTIVATGPSAATLHYHALSRKLRRGEMLLIDCGAEYGLYAGDITRVLPVGGVFGDVHGAIYDCVVEAQQAALRKVRHGVRIRAVYDAAARVLTEGLVDLGVLKGKVSSLMNAAAYKPWFPHGIGHSLGLDVHDVGNLRGNNEAVLKRGMVFTVEPGLYFRRKAGHAPPCGVRIEDDVLVEAKGCRVLSAGFPKERAEVEQLWSEG